MFSNPDTLDPICRRTLAPAVSGRAGPIGIGGLYPNSPSMCKRFGPLPEISEKYKLPRGGRHDELTVWRRNPRSEVCHPAAGRVANRLRRRPANTRGSQQVILSPVTMDCGLSYPSLRVSPKGYRSPRAFSLAPAMNPELNYRWLPSRPRFCWIPTPLGFH